MAIFPDNVEFASLAGTCHGPRPSYKAQIPREMVRLFRRWLRVCTLQGEALSGGQNRMMTNTRHVMKWLITATLAALCSLGVGLAAQTAPSSTQTSPSSTQTVPSSTQTAPAKTPSQKGDDDTTRAQLARFDQFLDNHPETAEQLRKNPSLVNN